MRTIVAGSRTGFTNLFVYSVLEALYIETALLDELVSGTANGVDKFGESWAKQRQVPIKRFPAYWDIHGKAAGPIRNAEMADYADALIAFWDGESKGTANMISEARKRGLSVTVVTLQTYPAKPPISG